MAIKMLDLRIQSERCNFINTPKEEIIYAEAFWQSVKLQPTIESRLVSSDIKQRLGKRNASSKSREKQSSSAVQGQNDSDKKLNDLFVRARGLDEIERFKRLRKLAAARIQDLNALHRRREERIKKEQAMKDTITKTITSEDAAKLNATRQQKVGEAYIIEEMIKEIDEFDRKKREQRYGRSPGPGHSEDSKTLSKQLNTDPEIIVLVTPIKN